LAALKAHSRDLKEDAMNEIDESKFPYGYVPEHLK